jgi:hypothetical protein
MKSRFPGYNRPTDEEFRQLWQECVFAFDANMLLHIYRYTPETQESFFLALERLKDRIWIPYQAATEYYDNREKVIGDQLKVYDDINKLLDEAYKKLENQLAAYKSHVSVKTEQVLESIKYGLAKAKESLEENKQTHPDVASSDILGDRIAALFEGKVGNQFSTAKLLEIYEEAERRFKAQIPPGFKDAKGKEYPEKYGDMVMWFQLIEHGKAQRKPIIFVTDDRKEDWWLKEKGQTVSPRPELINEIENEAHVNFYMYHSEQFLKNAQEFLELEDQQAAIQEVEEIGKQDEAYQGAIDYFESQSSISRRVLENPKLDDRLLRDAAEAARSLNNPLIRQAIETASSFDSLVARRAIEDARAFNDPLMRRRIEDARAFDNPLIRQAIETARVVENPLAKQAIEAVTSSFSPSVRRIVEDARTFDSSLMWQAAEAARAWRNNPLSGHPIPQTISVNISPKQSSDLQNIEGSKDVKVEVILNSDLYDSPEGESEEDIENFKPRAATPPYEFNNSPRTITLTHFPRSAHSRDTLHRLRNPTSAEWEEWGLNIECTRRHLSPAEIDEHNAYKGADEEKVTEIWELFYGEWEASERLYNKIILEIAGVTLGKNDDFPTDQFRSLAPEVIAKVPFEFKETVVTGLYECWCGLESPVSPDDAEQRIYQNLPYKSSSYDVIHTLRKPTEDEGYVFRTNIVKGYFSTNEDGQEIIQLKLNLSTAIEFYEKLILNIENATVDGQPFSGGTRNAFLESINPIHKLRVLEPLFDVNAWYFKIDEIRFL